MNMNNQIADFLDHGRFAIESKAPSIKKDRQGRILRSWTTHWMLIWRQDPRGKTPSIEGPKLETL